MTRLYVPSCSKYRATWEPWLKFCEKSWPDCPYDKCLITDRCVPIIGWDRISYVEEDNGWCRTLRDALRNHYPDELILMILDDHWIDGSVETEVITETESMMERHDGVACMRLSASPGVESELFYGPHPPEKPYRVCTAPAFWRVKFLKQILDIVIGAIPNASAQKFETIGSQMCPHDMKIFSVKEGNTLIPFMNSAIVRGKWSQNCINKAAEIGVTVDTSGREIME